MNKDKLKKEEVWVRVVEAYVGAANAIRKTGAVEWADYIMGEYDIRFPENNDE